MSKKLQYMLNWFAVFFWMGVIYYFSNQPDLRSAFEPAWDYVLRKGAHFLEYFTLCYLLYRAIGAHGIPVVPAIFMSIVVAVGYAVSDEWHQGWIAGRVGSPIDVSIDTLGILACAALLFKRSHRIR